MKKQKQVINVDYRVVIEGNIYFRSEDGPLIRLETHQLTLTASKELCKAMQN